MYNPISTYRIQFNKEFCLKDLEEQVEYLSALEVGTIYRPIDGKGCGRHIHVSVQLFDRPQ